MSQIQLFLYKMSTHSLKQVTLYFVFFKKCGHFWTYECRHFHFQKSDCGHFQTLFMSVSGLFDITGMTDVPVVVGVWFHYVIIPHNSVSLSPCIWQIDSLRLPTSQPQECRPTHNLTIHVTTFWFYFLAYVAQSISNNYGLRLFPLYFSILHNTYICFLWHSLFARRIMTRACRCVYCVV